MIEFPGKGTKERRVTSEAKEVWWITGIMGIRGDSKNYQGSLPLYRKGTGEEPSADAQ